MTMSSLWRSAASVATMTALAVLSGCGTGRRDAQTAAGNVVVALNDTQLGDLRGGFDVSPNLSVGFGFQQTTSVNNRMVSQILVPDLTIDPGQPAGRQPGPAFTVVPDSPGSNGTVSGRVIVPTVITSNGVTAATYASVHGAGAAALTMPGRVAMTPSVLPGTQAGIAGGSFVAPVQSRVSVAGDQGLTNIMTQLGGGGLMSIIQSNANNALVQQATVIHLSVTGLTPQLAMQGSHFALNTALALGAALHH